MVGTAALGGEAASAGGSGNEPIIFSPSDVKEEPDECVHTKLDLGGAPWRKYHALSKGSWDNNECEMNHSKIQGLDSTLFQGNMRAWQDMQVWLMDNREKFRFFHMDTTKSGYRGFMMVCRECTRVCGVQWAKSTEWDSPELEQKREILWRGC